MSQEKVNIQVAAKALNVTTKTIHRYLANGTLTRIKEAGRTYIPMDEIRAIRQRQEETVKSDVSDILEFTGQSKTIVPVERAHYEALLTRLGQLETEKQHLLEYKEDLQRKDKELAETRADLVEAEKILAAKNQAMEQAGQRIKELQEEVERLKTPWFIRWFKKK